MTDMHPYSPVAQLPKERATAFTEIPTLTLEMMLSLTEAEIKCLLVLLRLTEGEGKESVLLTYAQIAYGTYTDTGALATRGSGLCQKSIGRAMRLLVDKGYITVQPLTRKTRNNTGNGDRASTSGAATFYRLSYRMRPVREWAMPPVMKPVPEARYGVKTPRAA